MVQLLKGLLWECGDLGLDRGTNVNSWVWWYMSVILAKTRWEVESGGSLGTLLAYMMIFQANERSYLKQKGGRRLSWFHCNMFPRPPVTDEASTDSRLIMLSVVLFGKAVGSSKAGTLRLPVAGLCGGILF